MKPLNTGLLGAAAMIGLAAAGIFDLITQTTLITLVVLYAAQRGQSACLRRRGA